MNNPYLIILIISGVISIMFFILRLIRHLRWARAEMDMMGACVGYNLIEGLIVSLIIFVFFFLILCGGYFLLGVLT